MLENKETELARGNRNRDALAIETSPDELDRIQHASSRDSAMDNLERASSRLRDVRGALGRMNAGTFGVCADCQEIISLRRLVAVPWASLCIGCQERADRDQKAPQVEINESLAA
jgi:DnaK suppressor protein